MTDPIDRAPFYHDGMRELQDRFDGRRVADGLGIPALAGPFILAAVGGFQLRNR